MTDLNINPIKTGTAAATSTRSVSDATVAEQFCIVASDIRNMLQTMKTSLDLQKIIAEGIDASNKKLDTLAATMESSSSKIDTLAAKMDDSMAILTSTLTTFKDGMTLFQTGIDTLKKSIDNNESHIAQMSENAATVVNAIAALPVIGTT